MLRTLCLLMLMISITKSYISQNSFNRVKLAHKRVIQSTFFASESSTRDLPSRTTYLVSGVVLPALFAYEIPELLSRVTDFSASASERQTAILLLLLTKRVALYSAAIGVFHLASTRALNVSAELGKRIAALNEDIFGVFGTDYAAALKEETSGAMAVLDELEGGSQAALLPTLVATSLAISFLPIFAAQKLAGEPTANNPIFTSVLTSVGLFLQTGLQSVAVLSASVVCVLFARVEILATLRSFGVGARSGETDVVETVDRESEKKGQLFSELPSTLSTAAATVLTAASFLSPAGGWGWVLQNTVNALVAIVAARAVQLPRLVWVVAALSGLVVYDLVAVSGTQALTDNGSSIMEAVARAKAGLPAAQDAAAAATATLTSPLVASATNNMAQQTWAPGLLQVAVGGQPSDLLGLGDVVFPSMLGGWTRRYDARSESDLESVSASGASLYPAALTGFGVGCLACEVFQTGSGQPALVFIVPAMTAAVLLAAVVQGQLTDAIAYSPKPYATGSDTE